MITLVIEHRIIADMPDGEPLPPLFEGGGVWRVVRRLPSGHTQWRRIQLEQSRGRIAAAPRDLSLGGNEDDNA
jgi:hypothetical protein